MYIVSLALALISHPSKVMLKILQSRLQQYVNGELPDVQAGFIFMGSWTWHLKASPENHLSKVYSAQLKTRFINTLACFNSVSADFYVIYKQASIDVTFPKESRTQESHWHCSLDSAFYLQSILVNVVISNIYNCLMNIYISDHFY